MIQVVGSAQLYEVMNGVNLAMAKSQKQFEDNANSGYDLACQHFYALIGSSNNIAYSYMLEVMDEFEEQGKLKFKAKEYANKAIEVYNKFFHAVQRVFMDFDAKVQRDAQMAVFSASPEDKAKAEENYLKIIARRGQRSSLWKDLIVAMYGITEDERENLRDKIYKYLVKMDVKGNLELMSKVMLSEELIYLSFEQYDAFFKMVAKEWSHGFNWNVAFPNGKLEDMLKWWQKAIALMMKLPKDIELNKDYETRKAYKKMMRAEMSGAKMNKASDKAIGYDPELQARVDNGEFDDTDEILV